LQTHHFLGHKPVIPEVAYMEAKNNLRERAELLISKQKANGERSTSNREKLVRLFNYKSINKSPKWNVANLLKRWESHVKSLLREFDGSILPKPEVTVNELLKRSLDRQKPFSKGDKGFRDTLIWLSTLSIANTNTRISFVTQNISDFFEKESKNPHPEIIQGANKHINDQWEMLFHRSLNEFIAHFDSDKSGSAQALQRALISEQLSGFSLWTWLEENLPHILGGRDFDGIQWAGLSCYAEAPTLEAVEELVSLDIPNGLQYLRDDMYRIHCDVGCIGYLRCQVLFSSAESLISPKQILWKDDEDVLWTYTDIRNICTFAVSLDFDARTRRVVSAVAIPLTHWQSYDDVTSELEEEREYASNLESEKNYNK
ncbi:MAG: PIN domain-containing protein, partial [Cyanobacteria bacterium J06555_13]